MLTEGAALALRLLVACSEGDIAPQGSAPSPLNAGMLVTGQNSLLLRQLVLMVLNRASLPLLLVKVD